MSSLNKVMLIGRLGKDPEIRKTQDGRPIANLSVATSERWTDKNSGEKRERTEWHRVTIYNENLAGLAEKYISKGSQVYLEGQLQTRKWQDKEGNDKYSTEVVLQGFGGQMVFLSTKDGDGASQAAPASAQGSLGADLDDSLDEVLPF